VKNKKEMDELMDQIGALGVVTEAQEEAKESRQIVGGLEQEKTAREDGVFEMASEDALPAFETPLDSSLPKTPQQKKKETIPPRQHPRPLIANPLDTSSWSIESIVPLSFVSEARSR
jgi:hypothetical protein